MGEDALEKLEAALRPIEKYAVRFLEEVRYGMFTVLAPRGDLVSHLACVARNLQGQNSANLASFQCDADEPDLARHRLHACVLLAAVPDCRPGGGGCCGRRGA